MPVYFDTQKQRWRFTFNRIINGQRHRASRLLPKDWNRTRAEAYSRKEEGRLYALATGIDSTCPDSRRSGLLIGPTEAADNRTERAFTSQVTSGLFRSVPK